MGLSINCIPARAEISPVSEVFNKLTANESELKDTLAMAREAINALSGARQISGCDADVRVESPVYVTNIGVPVFVSISPPPLRLPTLPSACLLASLLPFLLSIPPFFPAECAHPAREVRARHHENGQRHQGNLRGLISRAPKCARPSPQPTYA